MLCEYVSADRKVVNDLFFVYRNTMENYFPVIVKKPHKCERLF